MIQEPIIVPPMAQAHRSIALHAADAAIARDTVLSLNNLETTNLNSFFSDPKRYLNTYSPYIRENILTETGEVVDFHALLEAMTDREESIEPEIMKQVVTVVLRHKRINEKHLTKIIGNKFIAYDIKCREDDIYFVEGIMTNIKKEGRKDWYLWNNKEPDTVRLIDEELKLYECTFTDRWITTDPDIDQEVCQGYSDERGDYEYVRTFVTDLNEEEHSEEHTLVLRLV